MNTKNQSNFFSIAASLMLLAGCSKPTDFRNAGEPGGDRAGEAVTQLKAATDAKNCSEHGLPENECGICHPERAAKLKPGEAMKVRLPSADSASLVGVEIGRAHRGTIAEGIECYAELAFNQNKLAQIAAPVGGIVQ